MHFQPCQVIDSRQMVCLSASLRHVFADDGDIESRSGFPLRLSYGFLMDGVTSLLNMTSAAGIIGSSYRLDSTAHTSDNQSDANAAVKGVSTLPPVAAADVGIASLPGSAIGNSETGGFTRHMLIYPDPEFDEFSGVKQFYYTKNEYLTINVRYST